MARGMIVVDTIGPRLDSMVAGAATTVMGVMEKGADDIREYAQNNAPWTDRTGAARDGLSTDVFEEGGFIVIELYHTVEYGVWLELIQDGAYAIIMPTLEVMGPEVLGRAGGALVFTGNDFQ